MRWFENNELRVMKWLPQSPDLNPVEHLWSHLDTKVSEHKCSSKQELAAKKHEEREKLSPHMRQNSCQYKKHIKAVIKAKGGAIKY